MGRTLPPYELRAIAEELIFAGTAELDRRDFRAWLELTAAQFHYRIGAYSPEIRKQMIWLEQDRAGLTALFELLPKHHLDHALWFRQAVVQHVTQQAPETLHAVSRLVVFHTVADVGDAHVTSGSTQLFAVGRYHDQIVLEAGHWRLADRYVELDTRQLGIGSHEIV